MNGFLFDERGNRSAARIIMVGWLTFSAGLIVLDARDGFTVSAQGWEVVLTVVKAVTAWIAFPRLAQHISEGFGKKEGAP